MNQLGLPVSSVSSFTNRMVFNHSPSTVRSGLDQSTGALLDNVVVFPDGSVMWTVAEPEAIATAAPTTQPAATACTGCCCQGTRSHNNLLERVAIALLLPLMGYLLPMLRMPPQSTQALCQIPPHTSVR
jgi:hypothetical protein